MKVWEKFFTVFNENKENVGFVDRERLDNGLLLYTLNTKEIGISFKSVLELKEYISKFNYKLS